MSPKQRFNITLEPFQIEMMRLVEERTGATASAQIRIAIWEYLAKQADALGEEIESRWKKLEAERKRAATRKRS